LTVVVEQAEGTAADEEAPGPRRPRPRWTWPFPPAVWVPCAVTVACVVSVLIVTLSQLHPSLLFSGSTTTGGDNGGHYALPAFLGSGLLRHGQLTGWDPGWYDGFPLYTYYFVLPDLFIALASHIVGYGLAFKWGTVMGSLLLPIAAWAMARLFGLRRAFPGALAALSLCFLFDYTFTIYGGNLFSTLAGEYSYSLGIAFALIFLGLMAHGLRSGRYRGWAAIALAATVLAHLVPALFALAGAAILVGLEMLPDSLRPRDDWNALPTDAVVPQRLTRPQALWWGASTVGIGAALTAFWWVPFGLEQDYANSMGYTNVRTFVAILFPHADLWALILAGLAVLGALAVRSRFGILISLLGGASALAVIYDPQGSLYNTRFLPLWFLCVYLMVGWGIAAAVTAAVDVWEHRRIVRATYTAPISLHAEDWGEPPPGPSGPSWPVAGIAGALVALVVALGVVVTPFVASASTLSSIGITPGPNQVTNWSAWNYTGMEGKPAYPEYRALVSTMEQVGKTYGCGQAMWEYEPDLNRFGTTMALMLLPYWSNGCIGSMEGLLFESSATTPYHFINQAELSEQPSEPMVSTGYFNYPSLDVTQGITHLQLLGVKYFMASSPTVQAAATADPMARQVASTGPWTSTVGGSTTTTTWKIYEILHSPVITPLANDPAVQVGIGSGQNSWLKPAATWYLDPSRWDVELAQSGPSSWPRVPIGDPTPPKVHTAATKVSDVHEGVNAVSFHVSRVGTPVLVKVSYFPNWQAAGATGPYRVTPNLMVVVPTSHDVTLHYGATTANRLGQVLTLLGVLALLASLFGSRLLVTLRARRSEDPTLST
jgi:hypothetical protein